MDSMTSRVPLNTSKKPRTMARDQKAPSGDAKHQMAPRTYNTPARALSHAQLSRTVATKNSSTAEMRNTTPNSTPTVATEARFKRSTTSAMTNQVAAATKKSHQL